MQMQKTTKQIIKKVFPLRKPQARKYDHGLLLVIGGGQFYTGSPALAGMAAYRAGVDMVQVLAPKRAADIIAGFSPNLASLGLKGNWLDEEDLITLISMTKAAEEVAYGKSAVVIGGGLGRSESTKQTVLRYLGQVETRAVIDADGIHAVAKDPSVIKDKDFVLTPHSFEFFVLTGKDLKDLSFEEKVEIVKEEAMKLGCVILLTGQKDIISDGKKVAVNETGSPFMTVGGTGDTLAGVAGALLAKGIDPFTAGCAAAYINGSAGDLAAEKFGPGLLATDMIEEIPEVLK